MKVLEVPQQLNAKGEYDKFVKEFNYQGHHIEIYSNSTAFSYYVDTHMKPPYGVEYRENISSNNEAVSDSRLKSNTQELIQKYPNKEALEGK